MTAVKYLYNRSDTWLKGLSRGKYAVFLGVSGGVGVLIAGLLLSDEFILIQALTVALVMFGLEYVFGLHQTSKE